MAGILIMVCLLTQAEAPNAGGKVRRDIKPGTIVATNKDAVCLALQDAEAILKDGGNPCLTRYVFIPPWIDQTNGFQQVAHVVNSTITRTATRPQPRLLFDDKKGTSVVAIDLDRYATSEKQIAEIVGLYERLAPRDSWFNTEVLIVGDAVIEVQDEFVVGATVEIKLADGRWVAATYKGKAGSKFNCEYKGVVIPCFPQFVRPLKKAAENFNHGQLVKTFTAEPYLGPEGVRLFELTGSNVPIMRLDEWVAFTFSSINGGLYLELCGVEKNLSETVAKVMGADAAQKVLRAAEALRLAQEIHRKEVDSVGKEKARSIFQIAGEFDKELAKSKWITNESKVTRRQRAGFFIGGSNVAPADGPQGGGITFEVAEDNTNPDADPQRNVSVYETYNGGEAILTLPNGMLLYLVFDNQDRIIASVPDNIAWDHHATQARSNTGTVRVFCGTSCAHCHDKIAATDKTIGSAGWMPVKNDVARDFLRLSRILGDRKELDKLREVQRLAANYNADDLQLDGMLNQWRLSFQRAVGLATGAKSSREVTIGLGDSHYGYWNDYVWPETIVRDLGHVMTRDDAQAFLIRNIEPEPDNLLPDLLKEDRIIARAKDGESLHPSQYRAIAPEFAERLLFSQERPKQPNPLLEGMKP